MTNRDILDEVSKEVRRQYYREWRRKNPEKVRANNQRYWVKRAQKVKEAEVTIKSEN